MIKIINKIIIFMLLILQLDFMIGEDNEGFINGQYVHIPIYILIRNWTGRVV